MFTADPSLPWAEALVVDGDRITAVGDRDTCTAAAGDGAEVVDASGCVLLPGFVDLHGHGGSGHSFDDGPAAIAAALAVHRARGPRLRAEVRVQAPTFSRTPKGLLHV